MTAMTINGRAMTFDEWLVVREPASPPRKLDTCDCCGQGEPITVDGLCLACLKYQFGYDQAARQTAEGVFAGAVRAALEVGLTPAEIAATVQQAIDDAQAESLDMAVRSVTRALS